MGPSRPLKQDRAEARSWQAACCVAGVRLLPQAEEHLALGADWGAERPSGDSGHIVEGPGDRQRTLELEAAEPVQDRGTVGMRDVE